ncbi:hypothetical protein QQS21_004159 [Conoideocrella luteorostrata]|uniref:Uncharacterized protein n=1 Tax=Conoideocrella luteorostrata TaxID=1105319 RepID=A0AAJ0FVR8_9HYPO|nr:hypothetical protein QQS21_004159 [Conoideocrella luteorostrata]
MAFQQPTRQAVQRVTRPVGVDDSVATLPRPSSSEREPEESQTWVLFSPPTEATATSYLTDSEHSIETPGRSRLSDLGSLNTVARSEEVSDARQSTSVLSVIDDQAADEDAELDSLDSHLPDFRSAPGLTLPEQGGQHGAPVFPSHDGLGSFRLDRPVLGTDAQEQIYQFEQFNPRKIRRRLGSFDHTNLNWDDAQHPEDEKRQRIEAWRLDHSRVLLDEVQREARRQRKSLASMHRSRCPADVETDNMAWHDEDAVEPLGNPEGFVARITCKVVKDLFGIDDAMLSILLGQELPGEYTESLSSTPRASQLGNHPTSAPEDEPSWQIRILERLSRELGLLVNHLSPHPGAFATYSKMQHMPLPYAGLPVIPESGHAGNAGRMEEPERASQPSSPRFQPTIHRHSQPIDIPGRRQFGEGATEDADMTEGDFTKEEWERGLDIKLVFRYLVSRFTSHSSTSPPPSNTHHATSTQQENAAKVARIRQHHPLIARTRPVERRSFKAVAPSSPVALRHHSSCASQSTRRSARRSSCSSRHYWDIGGSLGTGSVIASNGPMGSWGEV